MIPAQNRQALTHPVSNGTTLNRFRTVTSCPRCLTVVTLSSTPFPYVLSPTLLHLNYHLWMSTLEHQSKKRNTTSITNKILFINHYKLINNSNLLIILEELQQWSFLPKEMHNTLLWLHTINKKRSGQHLPPNNQLSSSLHSLTR